MSNGWAVIKESIIVNTVSSTRRAAIVNWLVASGRMTVMATVTDDMIEQAWRILKGDASVVEVDITITSEEIKRLFFDRFFFDQDNDSHWYLVPVDRREERDLWRAIPVEDERAWVEPDFAKRMDGGPEHYTFIDPHSAL